MHERIAKIRRATLGYEDHGIFTCMLDLDYGGSSQGTGGFALDQFDEETRQRYGTAYGMDWIIRAMRACGVDEWSKVEGRTVIALFEDDAWSSPVRGIKPLPTEPGEPFMFKELAAKHFPEAATEVPGLLVTLGQSDDKVFTLRIAVEVNTGAWDHVYGDDDLRQGVEDYVVANLSQSAAAEEGAIVGVEVIGR